MSEAAARVLHSPNTNRISIPPYNASNTYVHTSTSSSAVAEKPRDASCLSDMLASTVPYLDRSLLLLVTLASDLPMRTIKLCSVVFGVTSRLSVMNKIHCVIRLPRSTNTAATVRTLRYATVQQWSMPKQDIGRKSQFLPQFGSPRRNIAITFGTEKQE